MSVEVRIDPSRITRLLRLRGAARVLCWTVGVTVISFIAVCWPLFTGVGGKSPARIFGGVELLLAGVVIMVGGVTDLLASDRQLYPWSHKMVILLGVVWIFASIGLSTRFAALEGHTPSAGYVAMAVILFSLTVALGTLAVWMGAGD
ncbi:hypothetical protein ACFT8W_03825 [Streptomyces hygroscopicus]|uniref:hypothetical protein n=1 Tax=Streptomyces hygroscopicus TaxID=1912 RepID=UPI00363272ED